MAENCRIDRWQGVRARLGSAISNDPVVYDWQHISSKALVIGGADDQLRPDFAADARRVAESLQNAELVLYPGIGHEPAVRVQRAVPRRSHPVPEVRSG